jgi:hypothetical protein
LTAKSKLAEAEFFLDKLRPLSVNSQGSPEFRYYASACTYALVSSLWHLLYDYANKYWKQLGRDEYLDQRSFRLLALATENKDASDFIKWYKGLMGRIKADDDTKLVWNVRAMEAHRGNPPLSFVRQIPVGMIISVGLEYGVRRPTGEFISTGSDPPPPSLIHEVRESSGAVYFRADQREPAKRKQVPEVLESSITKVKAVVEEAESKFGTA